MFFTFSVAKTTLENNVCRTQNKGGCVTVVGVNIKKKKKTFRLHSCVSSEDPLVTR